MRLFVAKRQGTISRAAHLSILSLALTMSVILLLGNPVQVHACKYAEPGTPSEELEKSSAVFAGRVVSVRHSYDPDAASVSPKRVFPKSWNYLKLSALCANPIPAT